MDNDQVNEIGFALAKITTEQFAVIETNFSEGTKPKLRVNFHFASDAQKMLIGILGHFRFDCDGKPFLVVEAGCHFNIQPDSWSMLVNKEKNALSVPKGLLQHLGAITVGTVRGILHAKTENTKFNRFHLPAINLAEIITEDKVFNLENNE